MPETSYAEVKQAEEQDEPARRRHSLADVSMTSAFTVSALVALCLVGGVFLYMHQRHATHGLPRLQAGLPKPKKLGAGLLLVSGEEALLLRRQSKHHDGKWGLPGGNAEDTDGSDLFKTAKREATEEMGRGKHKQKLYVVYICRVEDAQRAAWQPALNDEHSEARWMRLGADGPPRAELHPVVAALLEHDKAELKGMLGFEV